MRLIKILIQKLRSQKNDVKAIYNIEKEMEYRNDEIWKLHQLIIKIYDRDLNIIAADVNENNGDFTVTIGIGTNNYTGKLFAEIVKAYPLKTIETARQYIAEDSEMYNHITKIYVDIKKNIGYASYLKKEWKTVRLALSDHEGILVNFTIHRKDVEKIRSEGFDNKKLIWLITIYANAWLICQ